MTQGDDAVNPLQLTVSMGSGALDPMKAHDMELYGIAELAKRWGVTKQGASKVAARMTAPKVLACGRIWHLDQILAYEKKTGRKPVTSE